MGHQHPGGVGLRHRQLRLVDRHRPRRHADLGHSAAAASEMAHVDQPLRRGDDAVRRRLRRPVSAVAHGPAVVLLLAVPLSQHDGDLAAVPQPAHLGRVRRLDLLHRVAAVLVRRPHSGPGHPPRSHEQSLGPDRLRHPGDGLARLGVSLEALRGDVSDPRRSGDAAGRVGAYGRQLRFRRRHPARLALDHLSALLRRRSHLFRFRHGADAGDSAAGVLRLAGLHHAASTCRTWPRSCWRPG